MPDTLTAGKIPRPQASIRGTGATGATGAAGAGKYGKYGKYGMP